MLPLPEHVCCLASCGSGPDTVERGESVKRELRSFGGRGGEGVGRSSSFLAQREEKVGGRLGGHLSEIKDERSGLKLEP